MIVNCGEIGYHLRGECFHGWCRYARGARCFVFELFDECFDLVDGDWWELVIEPLYVGSLERREERLVASYMVFHSG